MEAFTWRSGERTVVFGEGALADAPQLLAEHGFTPYQLLSTERALAEHPSELAEDAERVHHVSAGPVPDAATQLLGRVAANPPGDLVAFGGGRVVDTAKAVAAITGSRVAAIPTTLAGSSMTGIHRLPAGREAEAKGLVRPLLVIGDPVPMTSAPEKQLRATAMNALAHGAESLYGPGANPAAEMAALRGAELIAITLDLERQRRDRSDLASGALLCASAIDSTGLALHHALCQTLVRVMELPHAETNAAMLPHTMTAMTHRAPRQITALAGALGVSAGAIGARISELSGGPRNLADLGADPAKIDQVLDAIEARGDVATNTPDPPGREAIGAIIKEAF
ncbi:MAG: iron-containing alcohol dehydrogenase [Solirubrobacterales bacterium]